MADADIIVYHSAYRMPLCLFLVAGIYFSSVELIAGSHASVFQLQAYKSGEPKNRVAVPARMAVVFPQCHVYSYRPLSFKGPSRHTQMV